jgi:hypothetical protein
MEGAATRTLLSLLCMPSVVDKKSPSLQGCVERSQSTKIYKKWRLLLCGEHHSLLGRVGAW